MGGLLVDAVSTIDAGLKLATAVEKTVGIKTAFHTYKSIGRSVLIEDIEKRNDLTGFEKAALISNIKQVQKQYENSIEIAQLAEKYLHPQADPSKVDEDWLVRFFDEAKNVSSEDFQEIWARILVGECNTPGSMPKRLMSIVKDMERDDALEFAALRNVSVEILGSIYPLLDVMELKDERRYEYYKGIGITWAGLSNLETLGLISIDQGNCVTLHLGGDKALAVYHGESLAVEGDVDMGGVMLTHPGECLARVLMGTVVNGYFESHCVPILRGERSLFGKNGIVQRSRS